MPADVTAELASRTASSDVHDDPSPVASGLMAELDGAAEDMSGEAAAESNAGVSAQTPILRSVPESAPAPAPEVPPALAPVSAPADVADEAPTPALANVPPQEAVDSTAPSEQAELID